jgi:hypothetical protein
MNRFPDNVAFKTDYNGGLFTIRKYHRTIDKTISYALSTLKNQHADQTITHSGPDGTALHAGLITDQLARNAYIAIYANNRRVVEIESISFE